MAAHLNPLEKEVLIRRYKSNPKIKLTEFCKANNISDTVFNKWMKQYDEAGLEGLAGSADWGAVLPEGIDRTEENYKREILKLRIENERLKKNYCRQKTEDGQILYRRLKPKNSKSQSCYPGIMMLNPCVN